MRGVTEAFRPAFSSSSGRHQLPTAPGTDADAIDVKILLSFIAQVKAGDFFARMPLEWQAWRARSPTAT